MREMFKFKGIHVCIDQFSVFIFAFIIGAGVLLFSNELVSFWNSNIAFIAESFELLVH